VLALFTRYLKHKNPTFRLSAAYALRLAGPEAARMMPALVEAYHSKDLRDFDMTCKIRLAIIGTWGMIGAGAVEAIPLLIEAIQDDRPGLGYRTSAFHALKTIGPGAKAAIPFLMELFKDRSKGLQVEATTALAGIGEAAVPALIAAMGDTDRSIRLRAVSALGDMGPAAKAAIPALRNVVGDRLLGASAKAALKKIEQ